MKRFVVRLNGIQVKVDDMVFHQVKPQSWDPFLVTLLFSFICTRPFFLSFFLFIYIYIYIFALDFES
jgi:hypothetical protein